MAPTNDLLLRSEARARVASLFESGTVHQTSREALLLDDRRRVYYVEQGSVDLFCARVERGEIVSRRYVASRQEGELILGVGTWDAWTLQAVIETKTVVRELPLDDFRREISSLDEDVRASFLSSWFAGLCQAQGSTPTTDNARLLAPADEFEITEATTLETALPLVWVAVHSGHGFYGESEEFDAVNKSVLLPLTRKQAIRADSGEIRCVTTTEIDSNGHLWDSLDEIHERLLRGSACAVERWQGDRNERSKARDALGQEMLSGACERLAHVLSDAEIETPPASGEPLYVAADAAAKVLNLKMQALSLPATLSVHKRFQAMAEASNIPVRRVVLKAGWWTEESGPLIATLREGSSPVALLPRGTHAYVVFDPRDGSRRPVDAEVAAELEPFAFTLYRTLPYRPLRLRDLAVFEAFGAKADLIRILLMGILAALAGFFTPLATGVLFDRVVPSADRGQLFQICAGIFVAAMATAAFRIVQGIAVQRLESRSSNALQSALWDRVLKLPTTFFSKYTAGDLTQRCMAVDILRKQLTPSVFTAMLASLFSMSSLALLFYYDTMLGAVGSLLLIVALMGTVIPGVLFARRQKPLLNLQGRLSGMLLQLLSGVSKLRVAGAEGRAFGKWSEIFESSCRMSMRAASAQNGMAVFNATIPIVSSLVLFFCVTRLVTSGFTTGDYLAFSAAFVNVLNGILGISPFLMAIMGASPILERLQPILDETPEIDPGKDYPGKLTGQIEVSGVNFAYSQNGDTILDDVSLRIGEGEFVALVGPSGSGKSTLLRLLLGFESPRKGTIYYDGKDLAKLDLKEVRKQFGVVLQRGKLLPGDIFSNIIGSSFATMDEAWAAARDAGLDEDIKKMPMGMQTVLSDGGAGLSGGQQQRLQIARALIRRPRFLFFDEATSALDNRTQSIVSRSVEKLKATRVVVAHRLSTVIDADRIFVLEKGRIVEAGNYEELMEKKGLFFELAQRQIA